MSSQERRVSMAVGKILALAFAASLFVALPGAAQYAGTQKPPSQQQPPSQNPPPKTGQPGEKAPGTSTEGPPVNKEEEDAAKALFALKSDQAPLIIQSGEDFLQKYSLSRYRASAYFRLAQAYLDTHQDDKLASTGDRALAENPDNVDVLSLMAWYLPHRIDRKALDADQKLDRAEKYGRHCLELIATMPKPEGITDEDFEKAKRQKQGMAHSGLGLVNFHRGKTAEMTAEFEQSTTLDITPDPLDFFLLGRGKMAQKKYAEATAAFDKCSQVTWAWQANCKAQLEESKKLIPPTDTPTGVKP